MKKDRINPKIKLTTRRTPITAESITYEQLELLPPKASVLVLKEYAFLLEAKWNELGQNNIQISRALERCRKINQMEKKRTIAQESLYFLMYAEDVKILISSTHYIPFDPKYLNLPPKESRNISPQTYYKELEKEIKKIEAQESSIKPVKKLGTWPKLK